MLFKFWEIKTLIKKIKKIEEGIERNWYQSQNWFLCFPSWTYNYLIDHSPDWSINKFDKLALADQ